MIGEKECLEQLETLKRELPIKAVCGFGVSQYEYDEIVEFFEGLIEEYFELNEVIKILEKNYDNLWDELQHCNPYGFAELKPNEWCWDNKDKRCLRIKETIVDDLNRKIVRYQNGYENDSVYYSTVFEENRYYPVKMANVGR